MRKNLLFACLFVTIFVTMLVSSIDAYALTSVIRWQDGNSNLIVNDGDDAYFEVGVVDFDFPLTISLSLLKDGSRIYVFEDKLNYDDLLFEGRYLISKEQYKTPGNFVVFLEAKDSDGESKTNILSLNVLEPEKDEEGDPIIIINGHPVVEDIFIEDDNGVFDFEIISRDPDGDLIRNHEARVLAQYGEYEYGIGCALNKCSFNSRDPLGDGESERILFDDNAVVKARAYDGKNWGEWYEEKFVIDNRGIIIVEEDDHEPVLESIGNKDIFENSELRFSVAATDADNDITMLNAENLPAGASFSNNVFTWKPGYDVVEHGGLINGILKFISFGILGSEPSADFEATFAVVDSNGNYDVEKVKIKVRDVNRLPSLAASDVNVNEGELVKVVPVFSDPKYRRYF